MPEPIEVRKVPIPNVSEAKGLADIVDSADVRMVQGGGIASFAQELRSRC